MKWHVVCTASALLVTLGAGAAHAASREEFCRDALRDFRGATEATPDEIYAECMAQKDGKDVPPASPSFFPPMCYEADPSRPPLSPNQTQWCNEQALKLYPNDPRLVKLRARNFQAKNRSEPPAIVAYKARLAECMGFKVFEDPQPPGYPPTLERCQQDTRADQRRYGLPETGMSQEQISTYQFAWRNHH